MIGILDGDSNTMSSVSHKDEEFTGGDDTLARELSYKFKQSKWYKT